MKPIVATYRLQLNRQLTFQDVIARLDYLQALNVSHLYLSPVMEAVSGSDHGYDVTDFAAVSRERGGEEGLQALDKRLRERHMHMILDIVPNHMAACLQNPYWRDVLMNGAHSDYWRFFDLRIGPGGKIDIPVLQDSPEALIASGGIFLDLENADIVVDCAGNRYPVNGETTVLLREAFEASGERSFADYLRHLPPAATANILSAQQYAFVNSVNASRAASYRRFFDITGLVALRMEDPYVFKASHRKLFELAARLPSIAGVRIDHIDGLAKPAEYLHALAKEIPCVWVEKILARDEELPDWPCKGTTGYEFIDRLNQAMVDRRGFRAIEALWKENTRPPWRSFDDCVTQSKEEVLQGLFPAEVRRLAELLDGKGLNVSRLETAIAALTAALPVYRVYDATAPADRTWLKGALKAFSGRHSPEHELIADAVLTPRNRVQNLFFQEWQKLTGPAMAKGLEDRAHYRYTPLAALNEVGCAPFGASTKMEDFCQWLEHRRRHWPLAFNAATTHDTKRSEDVRHRLYALADYPDLWEKLASRMLTFPLPESVQPATALLFLQAVLGIWPLHGFCDDSFRRRIWQYMRKAVREASIDTSWGWPDNQYEAALESFVYTALTSKGFLKSIDKFMQYLAPAGAVNSLAAQAVRFLSAGVPDIYQGSEIWNFSLVDPDNRGAVDFEGHESMLRHLDSAGAEDWRDGRIKLWMTRELLKIRRGFLRATGGDYQISCLATSGPMASHLVAFALEGARRRIAVVTVRHAGRLIRAGHGIDVAGADWGDTVVRLSSGREPVDLLSGQLLPAKEYVAPTQLFAHLPVAVLTF